MNTPITLLVAALACSPHLGGCERTPEPPPAKSTTPVAPAPQPSPSTPHSTPAGPTTTPTTAPTATAGGTLTVAGVNFAVPAGWKQTPPANQMRLAELQVADATNDPAKTCVVAFTTAGGDVQSNISRWAGQIRDAAGQPSKADVTQREIGGLHVSIVEMTGAYQGMGEAPKTDWMLRGAIVETPGGLLFVKMTGPAAAMTAATGGWSSLIDSTKKP